MSGIVESVARALYEADDPWHKAWPWPCLNPEAQGGQGAVEVYRNLARAAIATLREHTMVYRQDGQVVHELRGTPDDIWKTLLDAALHSPNPAIGGEG